MIKRTEFILPYRSQKRQIKTSIRSTLFIKEISRIFSSKNVRAELPSDQFLTHAFWSVVSFAEKYVNVNYKKHIMHGKMETIRTHTHPFLLI